MFKKLQNRIRNMPLPALVSLAVFISVLIPLLVAAVLFYSQCQDFVLQEEGTSLYIAVCSLHPDDEESSAEVISGVEDFLSGFASGRSCSFHILDRNLSVVDSGSLNGKLFPLELYPSGENLEAGFLLHSNLYRGNILYTFSRLNAEYTLVTLWPVSDFSGYWRRFQHLIPIVLLLVLAFTAAALFLLRRYFFLPAKNLLLTIRNPSMKAKISAYTEWRNEIGQMCTAYLDRFREYQESLGEINRLSAEQRASEIEVLQNQINAHFIYNTLNNIQWLASANRMDDVVHTAQSLDTLLRACAVNESDYVTIEEEIAYVDAYLSAQKIRFNNVFDYEFQLDPLQMQMKIPKFIVQPIVENSIYHGFLDAGRTNGHIRVSMYRRGSRILIEVYDNGIGIKREEIAPIMKNTRKSSERYMGVAIGNINKRIRLLCGREYGIGIDSKYGQYTAVQIILPMTL